MTDGDIQRQIAELKEEWLKIIRGHSDGDAEEILGQMERLERELRDEQRVAI